MQGNGRPDAIVLIGVSGTGKTTVGQRLAPRLGAMFLEGDDFHPPSNIAKMQSGTPLTDEDRWPWLQRIGRAIADEVEGGRSVVTACSALRRVYRDALTAAAGSPLTFVHLTIAPEILAVRMKARQQHFMPPALLASQLATLEPLAPDEIGTTIAETGTADSTVEAICRWLRPAP